jgi:CHAD domain-containing protein
MRIAIKRRRYISDALRDVLPPDRLDQIIAACTLAQNEYGLIHDAHFVAERALRFVAEHRTDTQRVDQHVIRGILAFAETQQHIVEDHLGQWREHLMPLLML